MFLNRMGGKQSSGMPGMPSCEVNWAFLVMLFLFWKRLYPTENSLTMRALMVQKCARRTWGPPTNWRLTGLMGCPGNGGKLLPLRLKRSRSFQVKEPESF